MAAKKKKIPEKKRVTISGIYFKWLKVIRAKYNKTSWIATVNHLIENDGIIDYTIVQSAFIAYRKDTELVEQSLVDFSLWLVGRIDEQNDTAKN